MPSKITAGRVRLTLDGKPFVLEPTLRAITEILWQYGEFSAVYAELLTHNVETIAFVIRCGLGPKGRKVNLFKRLYRNGVTEELLASLIEFIAVLANGGKPPAAEGDAQQGRARRE